MGYVYLFGALLGLVGKFLIPKPQQEAHRPPPGMLHDTLQVEDVEVPVRAWLSYCSYLLKHNGEQAFLDALPDSNCVGKEVWYIFMNRADRYDRKKICPMTSQPKGYFNEEYLAKYYRIKRKELKDFYDTFSLPITGISYEQAIRFCEWRTQVNPEHNCSYRLPTEQEFKEINLKGFKDSEKEAGLRDSMFNTKCQCISFNYKVIDCNDIKSKEWMNKLMGVAYFFSDMNGVYDLQGNVSEMTMTKGVSKGGNYTLFAAQAHPDSTQYYAKPEKWLGFRCVKDF